MLPMNFYVWALDPLYNQNGPSIGCLEVLCWMSRSSAPLIIQVSRAAKISWSCSSTRTSWIMNSLAYKQNSSLAFNCWAKCNFLNKNINWRFGLAPPLLGRASSHLMKQVDLRSTELTNAASQVTWWTKSSSTVDEWSCSIWSI